MEKFAEETADRIGGDKGNFVYFEIANYVVCGCQDAPKISWQRILKGFEASERLYGPSMLNLNWIAKSASRFDDLDAITADQAFKRIGDQWDEETWETKKDFDSIKVWISGYAPVLERRRAAEVSAETSEDPGRSTL